MYKFLKRGRVAVSILITVAVTLAFLFFSNRETDLFNGFLKIQFVPALLGVFTGSAIILVLLTVLTLLFGRVYCSTICPLGTLQDATSRTASLFKSKKSRRFKYSSPNNLMRYLILGAAGIPLIFGSSAVIAFLDPYSNYGKISSEITGRLEQYVHNLLSTVFPDTIFFRSYSVFIAGSFIFALAFLILVLAMSALRGRLYCNTICPVGTLLGFVSRFSAFKPEINRESCNKCTLCVTNCKAECIDLKNSTIDESRCVGCLNCMTVCKKGAVTYKYSWKKRDEQNEVPANAASEPVPASSGRRDALITLGLVGTFLAVKAVGKVAPLAAKPKKDGIAPPGAVSIDNLKSNCTACQACVTACPNGIIKPATGEYGTDGLLMPVLSFDKHFCGYDCNVCTQVCPNGALIPLEIEEKRLTQIGKVRFNLKKCIVFTDKTDCGACDEHCPTKAITMIPWGEEGLFIPKVNRNICIGCGGCEYVCPAKEKAMIVEPNEVHAIAQKPKEEKQEKVKVDEFGF